MTRYRHLYTSVSSSVEIQIVNRADTEDEAAYFAIAFKGRSYFAMNDIIITYVLKQLHILLIYTNRQC